MYFQRRPGPRVAGEGAGDLRRVRAAAVLLLRHAAEERARILKTGQHHAGKKLITSTSRWRAQSVLNIFNSG